MTQSGRLKILVLGDSIGLPHFHRFRDEVEVAYDDVYPEQLRRLVLGSYPEDDVIVLNQCRHANTSLALCRGTASEVVFLRPDFIVLQLGLADLWPSRARSERAPFPELEGRDPWVSAEEFRENFRKFLAFCGSQPGAVIIVNIAKVAEAEYRKYPEALGRTREYNAILAELAAEHGAALVDAFSLFASSGEGAIGSDGIHPTPEASAALALELHKHIVTKRHRQKTTAMSEVARWIR